MSKGKKILLNPGPVTITSKVRDSLLSEDLCHREHKFADLLLSIKKKLLAVYDLSSKYEAVILSGSGTCAVEAMLKSFILKEDKVLVISNGVYGERMADMLQVDHKSFKQVKQDWLLPIDLSSLEKELQTKNYSKALFVHNETTTGRLNDTNSVLKLCEKYSVELLLDAVSSFGGEAINFNSPALISVAATANKCLHGVTGVAFVIAENETFKSCTGNSSSVYFDLNKYWIEQQKGWCPFTPSVHSLFALDQALDELSDFGGWKQRNLRYKFLSKKIREEVRNVDISTLLPEQDYSSMISSFYLPENKAYEEIYNSFLNENFVIYAGQGNLSNSIFRLANMGDITNSDLAKLIKTIGKVFN